MRFFYALALLLLLASCKERKGEYVTVAILAKDKAHSLPLYLRALEEQTWPKDHTYLYIRTNDNNDNTTAILEEWIEKVENQYAKVHFDASDINHDIKQYKQHEWNTLRFKILGKIRQDSVDWAEANDSHYFVADCDNFIVPETIETLVKTNQPIIAPLLRVAEPHPYSNYHAAIDPNGYYAESPHYFAILNQKIKGLIEVPVVHCTYLVRKETLKKIRYDDESGRYEYVIFSDSARKNNIPQYIDNRKVYGRITFAEDWENLEKEPWLIEFADSKN